MEGEIIKNCVHRYPTYLLREFFVKKIETFLSTRDA